MININTNYVAAFASNAAKRAATGVKTRWSAYQRDRE